MKLKTKKREIIRSHQKYSLPPPPKLLQSRLQGFMALILVTSQCKISISSNAKLAHSSFVEKVNIVLHVKIHKKKIEK